MSYKYSKRSQARLATCHPDLQRLLNEAIKHYDITILEGVRSVERQKELVADGKSKTMNSRHLPDENGYSNAVDCALYPINWNDRERFVLLQGFLNGLAKGMGIELRLGVDWDMDGNIKEHSFFDGPHIELARK